MGTKIKGGYYIKARCIQNSEISKAPPFIREIWDWILKECNHSDSGTIKRGQCFRTYRDIQEGLSWYKGYCKMTYEKWQCENAMKWLKKATMIATTKATRGLFITVLNYNKYQDANNYDSHTIATREPQSSHTINKNVKNVKKESTPCAEVKTSASVGIDINKDITTEPKKYELKTDLQRVVCAYKMLKGFPKDDRAWDKLNFSRCSKSAKQLLEYFKQDGRRAINCMQDIATKLSEKGLDYTFETLVKHASDWQLRNGSEGVDG